MKSLAKLIFLNFILRYFFENYLNFIIVFMTETKLYLNGHRKLDSSLISN